VSSLAKLFGEGSAFRFPDEEQIPHARRLAAAQRLINTKQMGNPNFKYLEAALARDVGFIPPG
jgi:hypothetical protein